MSERVVFKLDRSADRACEIDSACASKIQYT